MVKYENKKKSELIEEINNLKFIRDRLIVIAIIFGLLLVVSISLLGEVNDKKSLLENDLKKCQDFSYGICEGFNDMANLAGGLVRDYINNSFEYKQLPDCNKLKR